MTFPPGLGLRLVMKRSRDIQSFFQKKKKRKESESEPATASTSCSDTAQSSSQQPRYSSDSEVEEQSAPLAQDGKSCLDSWNLPCRLTFKLFVTPVIQF